MGSKFGVKNVPRGTLVWNGNPQNLVFVEIYFLKGSGNIMNFFYKGLSLHYFAENMFVCPF